MNPTTTRSITLASILLTQGLQAGEQIFGYIRGVEPLPQGAWEAYTTLTSRFDKGQGHYEAYNLDFELEYGVTDSLSLQAELKTLSLDTTGLIIDGYLPEEINRTGFSGFEFGALYNILKPAMDGIGLSTFNGLEYGWVDPHSGQDKDTLSYESRVMLQKYFMEGQVILGGDFGLEATWADRGEIAGLNPSIEWSTDPEVEIELQAGTGLSYRFAPNWYASLEAKYETEFETDVGQERWSLFMGPSIHYANKDLWMTLAWFPQIAGGGEKYLGQDENLHLIEKTAQEIRLKVGFNF
jgi:hypothetical protein